MKKSYYNIGSIGFVFMLTVYLGNIKAQTKMELLSFLAQNIYTPYYF